MKITLVYKDFKGHAGRKGKVGGSLPKGEGGSEPSTLSLATAKVPKGYKLLAGAMVKTGAIGTNQRYAYKIRITNANQQGKFNGELIIDGRSLGNTYNASSPREVAKWGESQLADFD